MKQQLGAITLGCLLTLIGLAAGWYAARQGTSAGEEIDPHAGHDHGAEEPDGSLSEQTLKNLGVEVGEAALSDFVRVERVQAKIVDAPLNDQPVPALLGGVVIAIEVLPGHVVQPGDPLVRLSRAPVARPTLELTAEILDPVSESMHEAVAALRSAVSAHVLAERELARVQKIAKEVEAGDLPIVSRSKLVELQAAEEKAAQAVRNAEFELAWHGLTQDELAAVRESGDPPANRTLWKRALKRNGLWGEVEESILGSLTENLRGRPWAIAAIGELSAAGLANKGLLDALKATPTMTSSFIDVASLLLQGNSVQGVKLLAESGALDSEAILRAPQGAPDWDVDEILVAVGEQIDAGQAVVRLHDAREMWLELEPSGSELAPLTAAFKSGIKLEGSSLVPGAGPDLSGLQIDRFAMHSGAGRRGSLAIIRAKNVPVKGPDGRSRSWGLRVGLRYLVAIPVQRLPQRFVLPASAVTDNGPERVVFVQDGNSFKPRPVHVEYEDDRVAVIANDGALFPGDPVVRTGAFALGLALQTGSGAVDPHAGHNH